MSSFQIPVKSYMARPPLTIAASASLEEAFDTMVSGGVSSLPALDDEGLLAGIISRTDLLRIGRRESGSRSDASVLTLPNRTVSDEMTADVHTVTPDGSLEEAARLMTRNRVHRVIVAEDGRVEGVLSTRDLMRALQEKQSNEPVSDHMSSPVFTIRGEETLGMAVERLEKARVSGLIVVEDGWPVGIFAQSEALEARDLPRGTAVGDVMSPRILTLAPQTRLHRAAAQAASTRVRRVVIQEGEHLVGILSGLDFAKAVG